MDISKPSAIIPFLAVVSLMVTACGGGGGGSEPSDEDIIPNNGVSITEDNVELIGSETINSMGTVQGVISGTTVITGVSISGQSGNFNFPDFLVQQVLQAPGIAPLPDESLTGVVLSTTRNCPYGGSVSATADLANAVAIGPGDTISATFTNCQANENLRNGTMFVTITQAENFSDPISLPFSLGIEGVLTDLSITEGAMTVTCNGDLSMDLTIEADNTDTRIMSGNSLTYTTSTGRVERITNYYYDIQTNDTTGDFNISQQGTLSSTKINGSVSFETLKPLIGNAYEMGGNPTEGQLLITTSADSSRAWLTAQSNGVDVKIEIDRNNDDIMDVTLWTTWSELKSK